MNDEDEEEDLLNFQITPSEIRQIFTTDLLAAKQSNERAIEETKTQISNLINKFSVLNCCGTDDVGVEAAEEDGIEIKNVSSVEDNSIRPSGMDMLVRKSLMMMKEKANLDIQVVHLMDQEEIKETNEELKAFYIKTKQLTQTIGKRIKRKHTETTKEIETNKQVFEKAMQDLAQNLPVQYSSENLSTILTKVVEKSTTDFKEHNKKAQEMTQETKENFTKYVTSMFPPRQVTPEEIYSKTLLAEDISYVKDKFIADFKNHKVATDQTIEETKKRVSQYPEELLESVKKLPSLSLKKLREKTLGIIEDTYIETEILDNEKRKSIEEIDEEYVIEYHEDQTASKDKSDHTKSTEE